MVRCDALGGAWRLIRLEIWHELRLGGQKNTVLSLTNTGITFLHQ